MFGDSSDGKKLLDKLIEVSTFGLDDLELNRRGKMSGLQRARLGLMVTFYFSICIVLFILTIGIIWVFLAQSQVVPWPAVLIWVTLCLYGCIYWLRQTLPMWADVRSGTVLCVSGPLHQIYTRVYNGRSSLYLVHYNIAKNSLDIAFFAPKFIPQDQRCYAYYTPKSEILIGIEPI